MSKQPSRVYRLAQLCFGIRWALVALAMLAHHGMGQGPLMASGGSGSQIEGFTEPYRTIDVASDETGIVAEVFVKEGDRVEAGQPLARLDSELHLAMLAIAEKNAQARGRLESSQAELELRKERCSKLQSLRAGGHARQEEVDRAAADVAVSKGNLRSHREDLLLKKLEYQKLKTQIARRTIRAPKGRSSGPKHFWVTMLRKDPGEFVAPNYPEVMTLAVLDPLMAVFTAPSEQTTALRAGQKLHVRFLTSGVQFEGVVEMVAPLTDAESGTVRFKVRLDNADGRLRSGERCSVRLPTT